jgi:MFS family permease
LRNSATIGKQPKSSYYWALFRRGQLRWTTVGILSGVCCGTAYFLISVLLPKALVDQGAAVSVGFGLSSLVFLASIPGNCFTGFLMEIIGRRWTIAYALAGSLPGLLLMLMAHWAGDYATVVMVAGALITAFTVLSAFTAVRVYLSEQFRRRCAAGGTFSASQFRGSSPAS